MVNGEVRGHAVHYKIDRVLDFTYVSQHDVDICSLSLAFLYAVVIDTDRLLLYFSHSLPSCLRKAIGVQCRARTSALASA